MITVWKTVLNPTPVQEIIVPIGAELLVAREQFEQMCVWYRCDSEAKKERRTIAICGTGHDAPSKEEAQYLGTCSLSGGRLQFHVFERKPQ